MSCEGWEGGVRGADRFVVMIAAEHVSPRRQGGQVTTRLGNAEDDLHSASVSCLGSLSYAQQQASGSQHV